MTTVAPAAQSILDQATDLWPNRNRASDGTIGDPAHASRVSDHNPDSRGIVHAADLTDDPANGCDNAEQSEVIKDDPRVKYVIRDRQIYNPSVADYWRPYTGSNPHDHHMHVSVVSGVLENNTDPWFAELTQGDIDIMDAETKQYLDRQFNGLRQQTRNIRQTQLNQGKKIRSTLALAGAAEKDLADLDADLEALASELLDG